MGAVRGAVEHRLHPGFPLATTPVLTRPAPVGNVVRGAKRAPQEGRAVAAGGAVAQWGGVSPCAKTRSFSCKAAHPASPCSLSVGEKPEPCVWGHSVHQAEPTTAGQGAGPASERPLPAAPEGAHRGPWGPWLEAHVRWDRTACSACAPVPRSAGTPSCPRHRTPGGERVGRGVRMGQL